MASLNDFSDLIVFVSLSKLFQITALYVKPEANLRVNQGFLASL
jgi:hypothetical protein